MASIPMLVLTVGKSRFGNDALSPSRGLCLARRTSLVLDTPEAGLDRRADRRLAQSIQALKAAGRTTLVATQRQDLMALADVIVVMNGGAIERAGPARQVPEALGAVPVASAEVTNKPQRSVPSQSSPPPQSQSPQSPMDPRAAQALLAAELNARQAVSDVRARVAPNQNSQTGGLERDARPRVRQGAQRQRGVRMSAELSNAHGGVRPIDAVARDRRRLDKRLSIFGPVLFGLLVVALITATAFSWAGLVALEKGASASGRLIVESQAKDLQSRAGGDRCPRLRA